MATSRLAQIAAFTPPIAPTDTFVGVQGGVADVQYAASAVVGSDTLGMSNLGNTLGTSGVVSGLNVELLLAGGNNITLSQSIAGSSATVTIIGGAGGGGDTAMTAFAVGNTTLSTSGAISFTSASFEGAGLVSLGISNGSIIISGTSAAQTNQTLGLFAGSNTTLSTSATVDARLLSFEGAGLVSVGASNGSVVISATSAAQTNQQLSMFGVGNTTLSTSGTGNASAHSFEGAGLVSVGISAGSVIISATSAAQTNQQLSMFGVGNTTLSTSSTGNASALSFEGEGLVSVGISAGSVVISATSAAQTNQQLSLFAVSNTTLSTSGTGNASAHSFEGAGLVSVGISGGSVIISGSSSQSNQQISGFAVSNTTLSTSGTLNASNLSFEGAGGVSVGISNGSVVISGGAGGGGTVLTAFATSNTTLSTSGTIALSNLIIEGAGAASVGVSNGSIIISAGAGGQTNQTGGVYASSNTTLSTSGTYDARSLSIAGAGAISVEASNSGWQISGPVQSFLIGGNQISLSSNANSITISFIPSGGVSVSQFEPLQFCANSSASSLGQSTIYFLHFNVPENLQVCRLDRLVSLSINAAVSGSTAASGNRSNSWVYQETIGLYSRGTGANSTNLNSFMQNVWSLGMFESVSIFSTGNATNCGVAQSYNLGFVGNINSAGGSTSSTFSSASSSSSAGTSVSQANVLTNVSGLAVLNVPFGSTLLSGGDYWLAMVGSSARTTAGTSTNLMSLSNIVLTAFNTDLKFLGQTATGTSQTLIPGDGAYSATATSFLSSLGIGSISNNSNASLYFNLMNVTL